MKNNIFRSFRFEIVLYSLLSLLYSLLIIAVLHVGVYILTSRISLVLTGAPKLIIFAMSIALGLILFITFFLLLTKKFISYIKLISERIDEISLGNFDNRIEIKNEDEFTLIADKLNQMAEDIKKIMENERRSEYAKNELITSVAHDLRTPLTSIIGYLDLVSTKELTQEMQRKYIGIAYNKSKRLEKLIEDLFTYTKFNFGEVKANYHEVDLVKLLNQLVDEFYPSFSEYGLEYEFSASNHTVIIRADGDLLARAFANLISNAIKYGKDGKRIMIELSKGEEAVKITVTNYGAMIPAKDLDRIFQRFYRVETSRSSETGGSGLGLAIAKSIVEMHGGNIAAESDWISTVFTVELKCNPNTIADTN